MGFRRSDSFANPLASTLVRLHERVRHRYRYPVFAMSLTLVRPLMSCGERSKKLPVTGTGVNVIIQ